MTLRIPMAVLAGALALPQLGGAQERSAGVPVHGVAYDSLRGAPLSDARVSIVGSERSTTTDAQGRFRFDGLAPGTYVFAMQHAALDSVGFSGVSTRLTIGGRGGEVRIAVPSFATLWRAACGASRPPKEGGIVYGTVRDATTRAPVAGALVDVMWLDLRATRSRTVKQDRWLGRSRTDTTGSYGVCGVPTDVGISVRASTDSATSGTVDLLESRRRVRRHDLTIARSIDSASTPRGTIAGVVTDTLGAPFAGARIVADDALEARSREDGSYTVPGVPAGTRQVEVLALGMMPMVALVDVVPDSTITLSARLRRVTVLDVVRVTGSRHLRRTVEEFHDRQRSGLGYMMDSTQLAQRGTLMSAFYEMPSLMVHPSGSSYTLTLPSVSGGGRCAANIVLDGFRAGVDQLLMLHPNDVAAVEVYRTAFSLPSRYQQADNLCGAVLVWTKWLLR